MAYYSMSLDVSIDVKLPKGLRDNTLFDVHAALFEAVGSLAEFVSQWLWEASKTRHRTADSFSPPAKRTGHLENAARSVGAEIAGEKASVVIRSPGITRALHPLDIVPVRKKWLTVPIAREAYGKSVSWLIRHGWQIFRPKGRFFLMGRKTAWKRKKPIPLFALKTHTHIRRDRGLLPTKRDMEDIVGMEYARAIRNRLGTGADKYLGHRYTTFLKMIHGIGPRIPRS